VDALFLDQLLAELRPHLLQRHLGRPREAARHALVFELPRTRRLYWDAARDTAGIYLLEREAERALREGAGEPTAAARHAVLLVRKHLEGARVDALERVPGTRVLVMRTGRGALALRLGAPAPAVTLALEGAAVATLGDGPPAWPPPEAAPALDLAALDPERVEAEVDALVARGWPRARALLAACPALGPVLARAVARGVLGLRALQERAASPAAHLLTPRPLEQCADADLVGRDAVQPWPVAPPAEEGAVTAFPSWAAAAAAVLQARRRGESFALRQRQAAEQVHARASRLTRLEVHLAEDQRGLPAPEALRHRAQALLAAGRAASPAAGEVQVPDPYQPENTLSIAVDPRLSLPQNADRLFEKARRAERAGKRVAERLQQVREERAQALRAEEAVRAARNARELPAAEPAPREKGARERAAGPRVYLTSQGLSLLVGRGARENQQLTFTTARPDDWWLHARDVPGAHVVVRDPEGRAGEADRREAAEVAAFFSGHRAEAQVDVHVTRRRNVRPGGAPGRVRVLQSETLRVHPRDPEGRLRRR
jgi:predicted ribosome quality control (RQC) complex YloA/Tae2 family protein